MFCFKVNSQHEFYEQGVVKIGKPFVIHGVKAPILL